MPGEPLTCIWQAAHVLSHETVIQKATLHLIFSKLGSNIQYINFREASFNDVIHDEISMRECRKYVTETLCEKGFPLKMVEEEIERECWNLCRKGYEANLIDVDFFKLWQICNRLSDENTYPPTMSKKNVNWLNDKIQTTIGKPWLSTQTIIPENCSFTDFVCTAMDTYLRNTDPKVVSDAIENLHLWLVREVINSGWMYKRTKKQANWTGWLKRWCVLTPGKLEYSENNKKHSTKKSKKGEVYISRKSKIENMNGYHGIVHKFKHTFKVSNPPSFECEFATGSDEEKRSWLSSLEEIVKMDVENLTPLQKILKENCLGEKETSNCKTSALERSFQKSMKLRKQENQMQENSNEKKRSKVNLQEKKTDLLQQEKEKIKAVFMKIDKDGNGVLNREEFSGVVEEFGLTMQAKEISLVFNTVDKDKNGTITYDEFCEYFLHNILNETNTDKSVIVMRKAFLAADQDGKGTLDFKEFAEFIWERKRSIRMSKMLKAFNKMGTDNANEVSFESFKRCSLLTDMGVIEEETEEEDSINIFEKQLKQSFDDVESEDLAKYIRDRWNKFATFRRQGATGEVVMKGGHGMVEDIVPGDYNLLDLACFSDLPPLIPKKTIIKGVTWESCSLPNTSGKLRFPASFDGVIETDFATSELLRYYGCSFADSKQEKVSLLYRHGIQDFTYENKYLSEYVTKTNGGAGLERHDFSHLDCPLVEDSGYFILAKYEGDELHITAFKVPIRHTVYIPGGCIHSNDYLKGTWRTMLSDETDIDHVHLTRNLDNAVVQISEPFIFEFRTE